VTATPDPAPEAEVQDRRSIVGTWTEVVADAGGLLRAEAKLARMETAANLRAVGRSSLAIGAGLMLLSLALVFLTVAGVVLLAALVGLIWALLLMAVLCAGLGALLVNAGQSSLAGKKLLPERTLRRMADDLDRLAARAAPVTPSPAAPMAGGVHERS
jgi:hypothetical protein